MFKITLMHIDLSKSHFNTTLVPWLAKTSKMMNMYIADVLQTNNFSITKQQWIVLKILHEEHDGIVQNELAFITNRNKASLTRLISVMEKNNLVFRTNTKTDARINLVYITDTGRQLFLKMKPLMLACMKNVQKNLSEADITQLIQLLSKIQKNITNESNKLF